MESKECAKCKSVKPLADYSSDRSKSDGKCSYCKQCKSGIDKKYKEANKEKVRKMDKDYYSKNQDKIKERARVWYNNNKERHQSRAKAYYAEKYVDIKQTQSLWNGRNAEKIKQYMRDYHKQRAQTDMNFRIRRNIRARFKHCVKDHHTFEYLGCDLDFFKSWIEYQFPSDPCLSWDNYGEYWQYDHVVPCASFDFTQEDHIKECFHWSNIRPLNKHENNSKNDVVCELVIETHQQIVDAFINEYGVPSV